MGYYHIELFIGAKQLCAIVLPWRRYEYQNITMGIRNKSICGDYSYPCKEVKITDLIFGMLSMIIFWHQVMCQTSSLYFVYYAFQIGPSLG